MALHTVRVNLLKVLETTFTEVEMGNAKYILWGLAGDDLLGKNISRNAMDIRSKRYATCVNIVDAHRKIVYNGTIKVQVRRRREKNTLKNTHKTYRTW